MRLSVSIVEGPASGRKLWLSVGQIAEIGRASTMDLPVPGDAQLAETHFSVGCQRDGCWLRDLSGGAGLTLNDAPPAPPAPGALPSAGPPGSIPLADGDRIRAGRTRFLVRIEGAPRTAAMPTGQVAAGEAAAAAAASVSPLWPLVAVATAAEIAAHVRLDEALVLLNAAPEPGPPLTPPEFVQRARQQQMFADALRFLAHALPRREAVWWATQCVSSVLPDWAPPTDRAALKCAVDWAVDPTEAHREATMPAAEATHFETAAGLCAMAASFTGGSLTPPGAEVVPPGPLLTAQAASAAVLLAAASGPANLTVPRQIQFLDLGEAVAKGSNRWPEKQ